MYLEILKINDKLLKESKNYFSDDYIKLFLNNPNFKESIIARYIISKNIERLYNLKGYKLYNDDNGKPIYKDGIYWSLSHKKNIIFIGISKNKLGVDIEIYKERDINLINKFLDKEYNLLGGENWDNFYKLWVAKESIIKKYLLDLNDIGNIILIKSKDINKSIDNIVFFKELTFNFGIKSQNVLLGKSSNLYFGICI